MPHFIYPSVDVWTVYTVLFVTNIAMNMNIQLSVQVFAFNAFEHIPRNGISRSEGNCMFTFFFFRNCHTIFHSSSTI